MTQIYFVRHAQPIHTLDDRKRALTEEGMNDCKKVCEALKDIRLDVAISSPYRRSMDTIRECAEDHELQIITDERLRERAVGTDGNNAEMFRKRWNNFDYHEIGGESLGMVQQRNIEALNEILSRYAGQTLILGTHGTALSCILNYYDRSFQCDDFLRIINYLPYIIRLDFDGAACVGKEEILIVSK